MIKGFLRATSFAALAAAAFTASAEAATFELAKNGGNGTGTVLFGDEENFGLYLTSNDNGVSDIYTTFTAVATTAVTVSGYFSYLTIDIGGSEFDPFGYFVGSVYTQLTADLVRPAIQSSGFSFDVAAGETFGFYILATDGILGSGYATAIGGIEENAVAPVPVPASGLLIVAAISGLATLRRRKSV